MATTKRHFVAIAFASIAASGASLGACSDDPAPPTDVSESPETDATQPPDADATEADTQVPDVSVEVADTVDPNATVVTPERTTAQREALSALTERIDACAPQTAATLGAQHALPQTTTLPYDPSAASGLDLLQASALALDAGELAVLGERGFVIAERTRFPTFVYGYKSIYAMDLPVFVSADSVLYAVHRSYDSMLSNLEAVALMPTLQSVLDGMRAHLTADSDPDLEVYLGVASTLLSSELVSARDAATQARLDDLVAAVRREEGMGPVVLFGGSRLVDFSQFEPRGHYTESPQLQQYFRALMWLGRIDLRLIETRSDGTQEFRRRELLAALALRELMDAGTRAQAESIGKAISVFVGEPDGMTPRDVDRLLADLGVSDAAGAAALSDEVLAQAVVAGGYGQQQIASQVMINGGGATLPLAASFALFGQAYVIDAHVLANVVYDRVDDGRVKRMLPDPLDVAFAALRNDQAAALLAPELERYPYARELCEMRELVDAHGDDYWRSNLYTGWLGAIRALSPSPGELTDAASGLPAIATTEAWGRRVLNTQLASWAELRHDTLLYAKQSYTGGATCDFPDAYVDPYPAFFEAIANLGRQGAEAMTTLGLEPAYFVDGVRDYFVGLTETATSLRDIAAAQRSGTPLTEEQLAFINEAVSVYKDCAGEDLGATGWYGRLFYDGPKSVTADPTIADVHTQPTDASGNPVGRVLHVATGLPRLMVMTADTCQGPRAYVGVVSSYFERVTEGFERLNDEQWSGEVTPGSPADVPWMQDLVAR